jgi:hypothetical protein
MTAGTARSRTVALLAGVLLASSLAGCGAPTTLLPSVPSCTAPARLALVAQSVPSAAYVPCITELPTGWTVTRFQAERGATSFALLSDRAAGRAVNVRLTARCDVVGASPEPARMVGSRTFLRLQRISPRYTGTLYDVFPGGCVTYDFDFVRGEHIPLMEDLFSAVQLQSRRQLRVDLRQRLGVELDP